MKRVYPAARHAVPDFLNKKFCGDRFLIASAVGVYWSESEHCIRREYRLSPPTAYATRLERIFRTCTSLRGVERLLRQRRRQYAFAIADCQGGGNSDPRKDFDSCGPGKSRR